jgi:hypothetical protein
MSKKLGLSSSEIHITEFIEILIPEVPEVPEIKMLQADEKLINHSLQAHLQILKSATIKKTQKNAGKTVWSPLCIPF